MDYDPQQEGARPKRTVRPPRWMTDYQTYALPSSAGLEQHRSREGYAEMTPLIQTPSPTGAVGQAPVFPSVPQEFLNIVQNLQEDNRRLQMVVSDMKRQMDRNAALNASTSLQFKQRPEGGISTEETWISTGLPTQLSSLQPLQPNLPPTTDAEEEWPLPPPPVFLPKDLYDPMEVQMFQTPQPPIITQELSHHLQGLQIQQKSTATTAAPAFQSHAAQSTPVLQPQSGPSPAPSMQSQEAVLAPIMATATKEKTYRGPLPSIPEFTRGDPRQFARLKLALDNILPADATERFKYQVLCDHLKFEEALLVADSYSNSPRPYSDTMASLTKHYGQPHQLSLHRIAELMDEPNIRSNDTSGFRKFALRVRALVGMLEQLGDDGHIELQCGSHVARLARKLPQDLRAAFRRYLYPQKDGIPSLRDFAEWLEYELVIQEGGDNSDRVEESLRDRNSIKRDKRAAKRTTTVLHGATQKGAHEEPSATTSTVTIY
ncbi:uncharacterized protein LOC111947519 [Oryzias latipes]|uniref:uncharacterized protein LOC111947519 n=1 Tax=Oryzias latipes TaxID=8090 RepID=UPI000CE20052|nr:uncharacterized protein LOC111947519 [Oryzias latipes]